MKRILFAVSPSILGLLLSIPLAHAGGVANATFPEQIVQEITSASQLSEQVSMVANQLQQLTNEARNLKGLPQSMWNQTQGQLSQLVSIAGQANALDYASANADSAFQSEYQSYQPNSNYDQQYQQWHTTTSADISSALQQQGFQASSFADQQSALASIEAASQSSTGRLQALEAGNQIAGMEVQQLQQLRQTQMADSDAQMAYLQSQNQSQANSDAAQQAEAKRWFTAPPPPTGEVYGQFSGP